LRIDHRCAGLDPREDRISAAEPITKRRSARRRDGEFALPDQSRGPFYRPGKQEISLILANAQPNVLDAFVPRDHAVEGDHQQPPMNAAIHAPGEARERVRTEDVLRHRPEGDGRAIYVAARHGLTRHDRLERLAADRDGTG